MSRIPQYFYFISLMKHGKGKKPQKYLQKYEQTIRNSQQKFKNKFKLTEKIQMLSSSVYQRCLSPWTRKRNESLVKPGQLLDQNNSFVNQQAEAISQTMRNQRTDIDEPNIGDFLRKIQFSKRKPQPKNLFFSPEKKNSHSISQKSQLEEFREALSQEKQFVIFPKQAIFLKKENQNIQGQNTVKKHKKKDSSDTFVATIQNFYDPFQHKSKETTIYKNIPKGMVNLRLKINELTENERTEFRSWFKMPSKMRKSLTKTTIQEKSNRENDIFDKKDQKIAAEQVSKSKIIIDRTQRTFCKNHKRLFSRCSITSQSESSFPERKKQFSHQRRKTTNFQQVEAPQIINHFTPQSQAVRRIKVQLKKSRKVKTQIQQTMNNLKTQIPQSRHNRNFRDKGTHKQDEEYLYKTFMKYKHSKKNSNDDNITKTLNLTFHNKKSFKRSLEKALDEGM